MVFPPIHWFIGLGEGVDLANFVVFPLLTDNITTGDFNILPHRAIKVEDSGSVVHLRPVNVPLSTSTSLHRFDTNANYTFPNETVKFFVIMENDSAGTTSPIEVRTSASADTADGTVRETITNLTTISWYTTDVIEGNFNGNFLTITNVDASTDIQIRHAAVVEAA